MKKIAPTSKKNVSSLLRGAFAVIALGLLATGSVAQEQPPVSPASLAVTFEEAVSHATHGVFASAPASDANIINVVIDPLIDGTTGYQSKATQTIQERITAIVRKDFPRYAIQPITPASLRQQPRVLVGTFNPVDAQKKTLGKPEAYWFCLVMLDLKSGKVIARSVAWVRLDDADATPTAAFEDSPAWTDDPSIRAYVANCQQSKVGDPINAQYIDGLLAAALISEADDAYNEGRYAEALDLYTTARKSPAGDQLRVYNGRYLSLFKLGRADQAAAFADLVSYGLRRQRLAVKFLFRPGSVRFAGDGAFSASYGLWLGQIAALTASRQACLQIVGHTSAAGPAAINDSLSLLRAEYVQARLEDARPELKKRTVAAGVGSRENLIGTGRDDASDALDRRVELKPINPCN